MLLSTKSQPIICFQPSARRSDYKNSYSIHINSISANFHIAIIICIIIHIELNEYIKNAFEAIR